MASRTVSIADILTLLSSRLPRVAGPSEAAAAGLLGCFGAGASSFFGAGGAGAFGSSALGSAAFFSSVFFSGAGSLAGSFSSAGFSEGVPPSSMRTRS